MTIHHSVWHPYLLHHVDLQTFSGWPRSIFPKFMKLISLFGFASCFAFPAQMIWVHPRGPTSFVHIILIYHTSEVSLNRVVLVVVVVVAGNYWGISWSILHFISMIAGYARSHNMYFFRKIRVREIRRCFVHVMPICVLYAAFLHKSDKLGSIYLFSGGVWSQFWPSWCLEYEEFLQSGVLIPVRWTHRKSTLNYLARLRTNDKLQQNQSIQVLARYCSEEELLESECIARGHSMLTCCRGVVSHILGGTILRWPMPQDGLFSTFFHDTGS